MKGRIKELRKTLGLTQQEFADRIGINRGNVATYETREGNPGASVITLICREFNVNETWLRNGEGEMFRKTPSGIAGRLAAEFGLDEFLQSVVVEYLKLSEQQRKTVREFVSSIAAEMPPAVPVSAAKAPQDMTDAELHAELDRQITAEREKASQASSVKESGSA